MIVSLMMTVEGSRPEMSRLINVEGSMDLADLSPIIDAAFGFSGLAKHFYMANVDGKSQVYSEWPSTGEFDEEQLTVAEMPLMTYVYDPSANWNIQVERLGVSEIDGPTPLLVDCQGPDIIEPCGGPDLMTAFHLEARRIAAGMKPDMKVSPLLLSFLPVMSPERLIERLSISHHPTVSERIAFTAEDLQLDVEPELEDDPRGAELADQFDDFIDSRPDLQNILSLDPNPERNPTLISAISEFFADEIPEDMLMPATPPERFAEIKFNIYTMLDRLLIPRKLTTRGALRADDVRSIATALGYQIPSKNPREASIPAVQALREYLTFVGLLTRDGNNLSISALGRSIYDDPERIIEQVVYGFPEYFGNLEWEDILEWAGFETETLLDVEDIATPTNTQEVVNLFTGLGIFTPASTPYRIEGTHDGRDLLASLLSDGS